MSSPVSTLIDDFSGSLLNGTLWSNFGVPVTLSGGQATVQPNSQLISKSAYDFTNSSIILDISDIPTGYAPSGVAMRITLSYNDGTTDHPLVMLSGIAGSGGVEGAVYLTTGGSFTSASITWTLASARYIRFRNTSGTNYVEYSGNGSSWTQIISSTYNSTIAANLGNVFLSMSVDDQATGNLVVNGVNAAPSANFTASPTAAFNGAPVSFTDSSTNSPNAWSWNFGDGGTSTAQNPSHTYTTNGTYSVSLTASNASGSNTVTKTNFITVTTKSYSIAVSETTSGGGTGTAALETAFIPIAEVTAGGGNALVSTVYQPLPQKDYEYRVFDHANNFIGIWSDVSSDFAYGQLINQNADELNVRLARSPDNRVVKYDVLKDQNSDPILDTNSDPIVVQTVSESAVGPSTDVWFNFNVDVYAFYGGYDSLKDQNGDDIYDENNTPILIQVGRPDGIRVYSGYIADFNLIHGDKKGVEVVVVPHATEMNHYVFQTVAGATTVSYNSADPVQMARDAMNNYNTQGGRITYSTDSMPLSGSVASYDFKLQRIREVQDKVIEFLPSGYYHYVHPGENKQYLLNKGTKADHTFYYQKHLTEVDYRGSITQLVNDAYFTGGSTGTGDLFSHKDDTASIAAWRPGLDIQSDSRVTTNTSAQILMQAKINQYKDPRYRTKIVITDAVYDIETIRLGQMVAFKNFGNLIDTLMLQIVGLHKEKHRITLDLDMIVPNETKRLEEIKRALNSQEVKNIPAVAAE